MDGYCTEVTVPERCDRTYPTDLFEDADAHRDTVVFGSLFNRDNATQAARENAIELAVRQVDLEGALSEGRFGIVFCDTAPGDGGADATLVAARTAAEYLVQTLDVPVLLGPSSSSDVAGTFEAVRDSGTLLISPSATGSDLTGLDVTEPTDEDPGLLWRTAPPDDAQGKAIAADMLQRGVARVQVVAEAGAYGEGLSAIFEERFGGDVELAVYDNANQLTEAITAAGNGSADEVLFIASTQRDVITFLGATATIVGYADKGIFLTDSAATADTLAEVPTPLRGQVRGTRPSQLTTADSVFGNFAAAYRAEFRQDATRYSFTAQAYDMTWIAMLGAAWAVAQEDAVTGLTVARGVRRLTEGEPFTLTPSQWAPMLERFDAGEGVDIRGASGALDFDPDTEELLAPIDVWVIQTNDETPQIAVDYVFTEPTPD